MGQSVTAMDVIACSISSLPPQKRFDMLLQEFTFIKGHSICATRQGIREHSVPAVVRAHKSVDKQPASSLADSAGP